MNRSTIRRTTHVLAGLALAGSAVASSVPAGAAGPAPLPQPTAAQLATARDLAPVGRPGQAPGKVTTHRATRLPSNLSLCQGPATLGARTMLVRRVTGLGTTQVVMGFTTAGQASAARDRILGWYRTCVVDTDTNSTSGGVDGALPLSARARRGLPQRPLRATAASASRLEVGASRATFEDATVVQVGNRLSWVVARSVGEDANCSTLPGGVVGQCGVFAAADATTARLARH